LLKIHCSSKKKSKESDEEPLDDVRKVINVDESLKHLFFEDLQEKYFMEGNYLPIKQIIISHNTPGKSMFYRYTYIPKLLSVLYSGRSALKEINWPPVLLRGARIGFLRDIFNPEHYYTHENICDAIWLACWIGTYWYHENTEK
jgi:hypothetical protein